MLKTNESDVAKELLNVFLNEFGSQILNEENETASCNKFYHCNNSNIKITNMFVIYVNIGQLPEDKVNNYVNSFKNNYLGLFEKLPENIGIMFVPVRNQPTSIEVCEF